MTPTTDIATPEQLQRRVLRLETAIKSVHEAKSLEEYQSARFSLFSAVGIKCSMLDEIWGAK
jgi:hypothetical protein